VSTTSSFTLSSGKFQTEIGKSWAAEIISRRKSLSAKRPSSYSG